MVSRTSTTASATAAAAANARTNTATGATSAASTIPPATGRSGAPGLTRDTPIPPGIGVAPRACARTAYASG